MSRPKNEESFRLFKRKLDRWELFYYRVFGMDGTIIATRSTGTSDERKRRKKAVKKALFYYLPSPDSLIFSISAINKYTEDEGFFPFGNSFARSEAIIRLFQRTVFCLFDKNPFL